MMHNDKLIALAALAKIPEDGPPLENWSREDLIVTALIVCHKRGLSPEAAIVAMDRAGVSRKEALKAFLKVVAYYTEGKI